MNQQRCSQHACRALIHDRSQCPTPLRAGLLSPRVVPPHPQGLQGSHLNLSQASAQRHRRYFLLNNKAVNGLCARRSPPVHLGFAPRATRALVEPSWHVQSSGWWWAVCTQTSRRRGRRMAGPTCGGFDLSSADGVGGLTAAAGIAIRSASCQQPRIAALVGAAAAIGLCAVARRRHRPSDLRSSCSSCCQSSALTHLTRRARIVRRAKKFTCMQTVRELGCAA